MHTVQLFWTKFENIWGANLSRSVHTPQRTFEEENEKKWPREFSRTINSYIRKLLITYHESQWYLYSQITFQMAITIEWRISHEKVKFLRLKWIYAGNSSVIHIPFSGYLFSSSHSMAHFLMTVTRHHSMNINAISSVFGDINGSLYSSLWSRLYLGWFCKFT